MKKIVNLLTSVALGIEHVIGILRDNQRDIAEINTNVKHLSNQLYDLACVVNEIKQADELAAGDHAKFVGSARELLQTAKDKINGLIPVPVKDDEDLSIDREAIWAGIQERLAAKKTKSPQRAEKADGMLKAAPADLFDWPRNQRVRPGFSTLNQIAVHFGVKVKGTRLVPMLEANGIRPVERNTSGNLYPNDPGTLMEIYWHMCYLGIIK